MKVGSASVDALPLSPKNSFSAFSNKQNNLIIFSFSELKSATKNFSQSLFLGEGGFGSVYKGTIHKSKSTEKTIEVAVKHLGRRGYQGHKEWITEVDVLGVVEHPNLVKLVGYCAEDGERGMQMLLVYEYMANRSVFDHLSNSKSPAIPWFRRLKIAQDAAKGLTHIHEGMDFQIIFRDFKSSNILLDEHWNAKLSDFGLARLGPLNGNSHVSTAVEHSSLLVSSLRHFIGQVMGTLGYAAPEYVQSGRLTSKSDVWSFGVFLYELLTGRRQMDTNRPKNERTMLEWVRPFVADPQRFALIMDPKLGGSYDLKAARRLSIVANRCLVREPKTRPSMGEVLEMIGKIVDSSVQTVEPEGSFGKEDIGVQRGCCWTRCIVRKPKEQSL